jgi:hypothetical protein
MDELTHIRARDRKVRREQEENSGDNNICKTDLSRHLSIIFCISSRMRLYQICRPSYESVQLEGSGCRKHLSASNTVDCDRNTV